MTPMTIGEIAEAFGDALEAEGTDAACDVLDELLLESEWGHELKNLKLKRDLRGIIVAAYHLGRARTLTFAVARGVSR